jgi:hypothetical protein
MLLGLLLFTYMFDTAMPSTLPAEAVSRLLYIVVFAGTLIAARLPTPIRRLGLVTVLIVWPILTIVSLATGSGLIEILNLCMVAVILVASLCITFVALSGDRAGGHDAIFGAIFGYFLIALAFAMLYVQLERAQPGSFELPESGSHEASLVYFSLVTITTLGYGDITPVSKLARVLTGIEAASGTMYVAVFIAMIIGRQRRKGDREE